MRERRSGLGSWRTAGLCYLPAQSSPTFTAVSVHSFTVSVLSVAAPPGQAESGAGLVNGRAFVAVGVAVGTGRHALERLQRRRRRRHRSCRENRAFLPEGRAFNPPATPDARAVIGL